MRSRWLKPEFFNDKKVGQLGATAAVVFQALWCMADDGGTALCAPEIVKGQMFMWWPTVGLPEVSEALRLLSDAKRIKRYTVGDDEYAVIVHFERHQSVHNPSKFRYPRPTKEVTTNTAAPLPQDGSSTAEEIGSTQHLDSYTPRYLDKKTTDSGESEPKLTDSPFPKPLCDKLWETWRGTGREIDYGRFRKALAPLFKPSARFPEEQLLKAIEAFDELAKLDGPLKSSLWHVNRFVENIGVYVDWGLDPGVDPVTHNLTPRGQMLARSA